MNSPAADAAQPDAVPPSAAMQGCTPERAPEPEPGHASILPSEALHAITQGLVPLYETGDSDKPGGVGPDLPHRRRVIEAWELLKELLLPAGVSPEAIQPTLLEPFVEERVARAFRLLSVEVARALPLRWRGAYAHHEIEQGRLPAPDPLAEAGRLLAEARSLTLQFLRRLPELRRLVIEDICAAYNGDPAAMSYAEVMLTYPGVHALAGHRIAHELYRLDVPVVPRLMSEHVHAMLGIDIHPGAVIGRAMFMDHATGIVIGETARVGDRVKLYQGVTLGAKSFPLDEQGRPQKRIQRHPMVDDDVVVYSNASILGAITIGAGSEIGGNVFLTHSVPPGSRVRQRLDTEVTEAASEPA